METIRYFLSNLFSTNKITVSNCSPCHQLYNTCVLATAKDLETNMFDQKVRFVNKTTNLSFHVKYEVIYEHENDSDDPKCSRWSPKKSEISPTSKTKLGIVNVSSKLLNLSKSFEDYVILSFHPSGADDSNYFVLRIRIGTKYSGEFTKLSLSASEARFIAPQSTWISDNMWHPFFWYYKSNIYRIKICQRGMNRIVVELQPTKPSNPLLNSCKILFRKTVENPNLFYDEIYENQRKNYRLGRKEYSSAALELCDPPAWSNEFGERVRNTEIFCIPSPFWEWISEWTVDVDEHVTDQEGWRYSNRWNGKWNNEKTFTKFVRGRRWIRWRQLIVKQDDPTKRDLRSSFDKRDSLTIKRDSKTQVSKLIHIKNMHFQVPENEILKFFKSTINMEFSFFFVQVAFFEWILQYVTDESARLAAANYIYCTSPRQRRRFRNAQYV